MTADSKPKTIPGRIVGLVSLIVAIVVGAAKFAESLKKLLLGDENKWLFHFVPDMIMLFGLLALGVAALNSIRYDIPRSFARTMRHEKLPVVLLLLILLAGVVLLTVPLLERVFQFYRARVFFAKLDHSYYAAREALTHDRTIEAIAEFREQGDTVTYLNKSFIPRIQNEAAEAESRQRDAELLLDRWKRQSGDGPTMTRYFMVERANVLCADCIHVVAAMAETRNAMKAAINAYVAAIETIRGRDWSAASAKLAESRKNCDGMLHQDLLIAYAASRGTLGGSAEQRAVLRFYLNEPLADVERAVRGHPSVAWAF